MKEIKRSCIEMEADRLIKMCDKMTVYIELERKKRSDEWKEKAIAAFRKKINKSWFSKNLKKLSDEELFRWMIDNCSRGDYVYYKMDELRNYEWARSYCDETLDACEEMIFLAKQSKMLNGKVFVTAEELRAIYREGINDSV